MKRSIIQTQDGSRTIRIEEWTESYHSVHGAVQEAVHVFMKNGLEEVAMNKSTIKILEIGYGTGLNALLTVLYGSKLNLMIDYVGIEKFPVSREELFALAYADSCTKIADKSIEKIEDLQQKMFDASWGVFTEITPSFRLKKVQLDFFDLPKLLDKDFDLIYFDAFGARVQPELWEMELLQKVVEKMNIESQFTTYAAKGSLKRTLQTLGLDVEKRVGPPGKREMMIAKKYPIQPENI
ncbi:bifunctional tRNA (mnm(5)s(2)U34)-methyltransferase/FAD-dependent cmnm(5)s(2)U34 oxidoreductase [Weeksella virosa]|uniref:tRNA (5-methylaminomethyl-2-thiouridine)(34)-methyltransferase MnmD n=1 Tax=Weeksella virosa TaxID=1014 RepID=UPI000DFFC6AC|nr:tRNA (5-methylaminomethyl-2-thiouridine)(34)-methyltransferase MnmD [Weeksella virosa]SUP54519.1 bifunctional tRNA (mnm(5)s(2)U34)-methyltransferase/FAD-dependent cmnm(5)s(2)U34 oxidoreductase [Weeksella virosa]